MIKKPEFHIFWILILLLLLSRMPLIAHYFSIDNVNLAFSLEKFDPKIHQPQPPGYLYFVLSARLVNFIFHDAYQTFKAISLLVGALTVGIAFLLGKRMFSFWAGVIGSLLLLVNPVFWQANIEGPLRPILAFFTVITAYCCWRCWNGEKRYATWGAIALGIGGGFRPDLIAYLLPLWLVSVWIGTRSWLAIYSAGTVLCGAIALWVCPTIIAIGGLPAFWDLMLDYASTWIRASSPPPGSYLMGWLRQNNRLFIWNGLSILGWIWTAPFYFSDKKKTSLGSARPAFLALWILPGVILQTFTHFDAPGHTLFSIVALCMLGGHLLSAVHSRNLLTAIVLALNVMLFFNFLGLPNVAAKDGPPSLKRAIQVASFESSVGWVRQMDGVTRDALAEIEKYTPLDRPSIVVTTDGFVDKWFMNWRIGRYYLPNRDFWVLSEKQGKKSIERVRRNKTLESIATPLRIPISDDMRILWLLEPKGRYAAELAKSTPLHGEDQVYYTDITPDSAPIRLDGFEIVPSKANQK
jgi:hypothetical protein